MRTPKVTPPGDLIGVEGMAHFKGKVVQGKWCEWNVGEGQGPERRGPWGKEEITLLADHLKLGE